MPSTSPKSELKIFERIKVSAALYPTVRMTIPKSEALLMAYDLEMAHLIREKGITMPNLLTWLTSPYPKDEPPISARPSVPSSDHVWLRDEDGTGSMHPCSKGDPGAVRYVRAD